MKIKKNQKKYFLFIALLVLSIGAGFFIYQYFHQQNTSSLNEDKQLTVNSIDYSPPTKEEKESGDEKKEEIVKENNSPSTSIYSVFISRPANNVVISGSAPTDFSGFITGVIEEDGLCTLSLSQGTTSFSRSSSGFADAKTTVCAPITVNRGDFSVAGKWQAILRYKSIKIDAQSDILSVEVK